MRSRVRRDTGLCALLALAVLISGCTVSSSRGNRVTVVGTVVDSRGPLTGAVVTIGSYSTRTAIGANGAFSLGVPAGQWTMVVSKSGYVTRTDSVNVTAPGPVGVGRIELQLDVPTAGGPYTDSTVRLADLSSGSGSLEVPTGTGAGSRVYLMLFPRTETAADYNWNLSSAYVDDLDASSASSAVKHGAVLGGRFAQTVKSAMLPMGYDPRQPSHAADDIMRRREKEAARYRSDILNLQAARRYGIRADGSAPTYRTFYKYNFITDRYVQVNATLRQTGTYVDIYWDNASSVDYLALSEWSDLFDQYRPTLNATFGDELDVDGNGKTIILVTPLPYTGGTLYGYFDPVNEFSESVDPQSNQADMIYINPNAGTIDELKSTIAHEYQHLIHFSERITNGEAVGDTWINEAFATLAEDLVHYGYIDGDDARDITVDDWFDRHSEWSLVDWPETSHNFDYGGAYLFGRYLYDRFGASATRAINRSAHPGTEAVTNAVGGSFGDLYQSWLIALVNRLTGITSPDERLNYGPELSLIGTPELSDVNVDYPNAFGSNTGSLRPWGVEIFGIWGGAAGKNADFSITGSLGGNFGAVAVTVW